MRLKLSAAALSAVIAILVWLFSESARADNWLAQIGGTGAEVVFDLVETHDGRLCATGTFSNSVQFGEGASKVTLQAEAVQDLFVACYSDEGRLATAVQFGADISDQPRAIAAMPNGDILVTGYFLNKLGPGKSESIHADGGADIFLTRLDAEGKEVWSRKFGGRFADKGNSLAVTADGEILLAGNFQNEISYEVDGNRHTITSAGSRDAFVFRLNGDGRILWAESFGGKGRDEASRVISDGEGNVTIAGTFEQTASVGDSTEKMTSRGDSDAFLISFDSDGRFIWSQQIGGASREYVSGLAADSQGNLYLSGNFIDELLLPDGSSIESTGGTDIFLLRFTKTGSQEWARHIGGLQNDESFDLAITAGRELLISGHFHGDVEILIKNASVLLQSSGRGNPDGFILTFDTNGKFGEAITASGDGVETLFTIAALLDGGIATAGFFNKEVTLNADGLATLAIRGETDVFLARMTRSQLRSAADKAARIQ